jgi:dTDP-glucose 4,6-dehydratase
MRVVVTGGAGFIGSNFIRRLISKHPSVEVLNIDKITYAGNQENLPELGKNHVLLRHDICDESMMHSYIKKGDIVVNFAAESHVDNSIKNANVFLHTNILGVQSLLRACREKEASLFLQVSTDEVYGSLEYNQKSSTENDMLKPSSPYSASKAAGEMMCFSAMRTYGQPIIITRSSNNYGPYQHPEKMMPLFITNLMQDKKIPLYGNGKNVRDWIFVEDNCEAIEFVMFNGEIGEIYNIGGGNELMNYETTTMILDHMGKTNSSIEYVEDRLGHDLRYSVDCSKLRAMGWKPQTSFEDGLSQTIHWYQRNQSWWKNIIER